MAKLFIVLMVIGALILSVVLLEYTDYISIDKIIKGTTPQLAQCGGWLCFGSWCAMPDLGCQIYNAFVAGFWVLALIGALLGFVNVWLLTREIIRNGFIRALVSSFFAIIVFWLIFQFGVVIVFIVLPLIILLPIAWKFPIGGAQFEGKGEPRRVTRPIGAGAKALRNRGRGTETTVTTTVTKTVPVKKSKVKKK